MEMQFCAHPPREHFGSFRRILKLGTLSGGLCLVGLLTLAVPPAAARCQNQSADCQNQQNPVNQRTDPDAWLGGLRKENDGKWNEVDSVSAEMVQILEEVANSSSGQISGEKDRCCLAAAEKGRSIIFDAYGTARMYALLGALKSSLSSILDLGQGATLYDVAKAAYKGAVEDAIKKYIHEKLVGHQPEVFVSESNRSGCKIKMVAKWDMAADSYEIVVYGDCQCAPQPTGTGQGPIRLKTFLIRITGTVTIDPQSTKAVPLLKVDIPKIEICANCNCPEPKTGIPSQPLGPGTTPQPGQPEGPGGTTPQPPPVNVDELCKVKPPCKECMSIYNLMMGGCKRLDELDRQRRQLRGDLEAALRRAAAAKDAKEAQEAKDEARQIEEQGYKLGVEAQAIEGALRKLADELKECEKPPCGPKKVAPPPKGGTAPGAGESGSGGKGVKPPEQPKAPPLPPVGGSEGGVSYPTPGVPQLAGSNFKSVQPTPGNGAGNDLGAYLPPIAGPGATIVATVVDPDEAGPRGFIVGTVDDTGKHSFFSGTTDALGRLAFVVPAGVTAIELFRHFDRNGNPSAPAHTDVGQISHLPNTDPLPPNRIPSNGPAITEANSAIERGGATHGTIIMHTRATDPLSTRVLVDNKAIETYAASDSSVVAHLPDDLTLGTHQFCVSSAGVKSNVFPADVVTVRPEPIPPLRTGAVTTVRVHVEGIPTDHQGVMHFEVSGAARLANGEPTVEVPVTNGVATIQIRAVHAGQLVTKYQLRVSIPNYWAAPTQ